MKNNLLEKYEPVIKKLATIYKTHDIINEYDDNPIEPLREYIKTLPTIKASEDNPNYDLAIRLYIKNLKCFKWRFVSNKNAGDVWNPLFESFDNFMERAKKIKHWYLDFETALRHSSVNLFF